MFGRAPTRRNQHGDFVTLLGDIGSQLLTADTVPDAVRFAFERLSGPLGLDAFLCYRVTADARGLELIASAGITPAQAAQLVRLPLGNGVCGAVAVRVRPIAVSLRQPGAAGASARFTLVRDLGLAAYVCHPLLGREGLVGTLAFGSRTRARFLRRELQLVRTVAQQVAFAAERIRLVDALRESASTLRAYYESAPVLMGIVELGDDGDIIHVYDNPATHRFFGTTADFVTGRRSSELGIPAATTRLWREHYLESARTGRPVAFEYEHARPQGPAWLHVVVTAVPDVPGHPRRFSYVAEDVTDRRRDEEMLRESDRRKDEFLATLAHELRNPLAPIRFALQLLDRPGLTTEAEQHARGVIGRQVSHMVRLVDDLLDVSRITRNKIQLRPEPTPLAAVMQAALESAAPGAAAAGHRLDVEEPPPPRLFVHADQARLVQVFTNLLNNAVKFTPPGGRIVFSAERVGGDVRVCVRDTGIGVDPALLPHVFDMFHQGGADPARAHSGLGIGLALARRLVEMHGGRIQAWSAGRGQGAEFSVVLPLVEAPPDVAAPAGRLDVGAPSRRLQVLVVDDNVDSAEMLRMLVETMGHEARTAHEGETAVMLAERHRPDVVLLDIGLPGMTGYEVARRIRARVGSRVHLAAITGWGQQEDRRRAREAGFDAHFTKPADPSMLRWLLASVAERSREDGAALQHTRAGDFPRGGLPADRS